MNKPTEITYHTGPTWANDHHQNQVVRYYNGHKYVSLVTHNFMKHTGDMHPTTEPYRHWLNRQAFTFIATDDPFVMAARTFRTVRQWMSGPSEIQRAIDTMIPGDMQEVPF